MYCDPLADGWADHATHGGCVRRRACARWAIPPPHGTLPGASDAAAHVLLLCRGRLPSTSHGAARPRFGLFLPSSAVQIARAPALPPSQASVGRVKDAEEFEAATKRRGGHKRRPLHALGSALPVLRSAQKPRSCAVLPSVSVCLTFVRACRLESACRTLRTASPPRLQGLSERLNKR